MWPTRHPVNQVPAHWSKDFVEHLRTVHFTLIAISAGLILLVLSTRNYNATAALVEVEKIMAFQKEWSLQWIYQHIRPESFDIETHRGFESIDAPGPDKPLAVRLDSESSQFHPMLKSRLPAILVFHFPVKNWLVSGFDWSPDSFPRTLTEFRGWWNAFQKPCYIEIPIAFVKASKSVAHPDYILTKSHAWDSAELRLPHFDAQLYLMSFDNPVYKVNVYGRSNYTNLLMFLQVDSAVRYKVSQEVLASALGRLQLGTFPESFADLSIAAADNADLPLEDIKDFLHEEASKGQEVFEAFGMKFPAGKVTLWGELLLLSVQLYFLLYLRQLSGQLRADDPGWDVPWVGMNTSRLGQTILFASLIVLPIAAMALLGGQAFLVWRKTALPDGWWHRLLYRSESFALGIALIASICLGILSWRYRPKVEAEQPSHSSPLFY
jgi:hypothetical protein